jgi:hypothetical protein
MVEVAARLAILEVNSASRTATLLTHQVTAAMFNYHRSPKL